MFAELGQDGGDVVVDRLGRDDQLGGDLGVGAPGADEVKDLLLAAGQAEGMLAGRGALAGGARSSSHGSTVEPISAATSSTSHASGPSRAARASTASRAEGGTRSSPVCSTSAT